MPILGVNSVIKSLGYLPPRSPADSESAFCSSGQLTGGYSFTHSLRGLSYISALLIEAEEEDGKSVTARARGWSGGTPRAGPHSSRLCSLLIAAISCSPHRISFSPSSFSQ
ncbi:unnamed protein product [Nezara viridula]|uniref:Uncharacterized protein n=1 Tax=Nezara viridula TaxID=85310 RepID=A0A9P0E320_NEZVI|nr:unnamed protein product [Nezara viridula]